MSSAATTSATTCMQQQQQQQQQSDSVDMPRLLHPQVVGVDGCVVSSAATTSAATCNQTNNNSTKDSHGPGEARETQVGVVSKLMYLVMSSAACSDH
jgi:hypothetical protein